MAHKNAIMIIELKNDTPDYSYDYFVGEIINPDSILSNISSLVPFISVASRHSDINAAWAFAELLDKEISTYHGCLVYKKINHKSFNELVKEYMANEGLAIT